MVRFPVSRVAWLALCAMPSAAFQTSAASQLAGTWTLNVAGSIYDGAPAPKSMTLRIEDGADGLLVLRAETVLASGAGNSAESSFRCDGKDYPFVIRQAQTARLSIACVPTATRTYEIEMKHDSGELLQKTVRTVSEDGRMMTDTVTAQTPDGQQMRVVAVLEKR